MYNKSLKCLNTLLSLFTRHQLNYNINDIYFLSFQQLLTLLEYSNGKEDFVSKLCYASACSTGYKDWYADFRQLGTIKQENPQVILP